jgi:hypothetical protein
MHFLLPATYFLSLASRLVNACFYLVFESLRSIIEPQEEEDDLGISDMVVDGYVVENVNEAAETDAAVVGALGAVPEEDEGDLGNAGKWIVKCGTNFAC